MDFKESSEAPLQKGADQGAQGVKHGFFLSIHFGLNVMSNVTGCSLATAGPLMGNYFLDLRCNYSVAKVTHAGLFGVLGCIVPGT